MDTITTSIRTDAQLNREADRIAADPNARGYASVVPGFPLREGYVPVFPFRVGLSPRIRFVWEKGSKTNMFG